MKTPFGIDESKTFGLKKYLIMIVGYFIFMAPIFTLPLGGALMLILPLLAYIVLVITGFNTIIWLIYWLVSIPWAIRLAWGPFLIYYLICLVFFIVADLWPFFLVQYNIWLPLYKERQNEKRRLEDEKRKK